MIHRTNDDISILTTNDGSVPSNETSNIETKRQQQQQQQQQRTQRQRTHVLPTSTTKSIPYSCSSSYTRFLRCMVIGCAAVASLTPPIRSAHGFSTSSSPSSVFVGTPPPPLKPQQRRLRMGSVSRLGALRNDENDNNHNDGLEVLTTSQKTNDDQTSNNNNNNNNLPLRIGFGSLSTASLAAFVLFVNGGGGGGMLPTTPFSVASAVSTGGDSSLVVSKASSTPEPPPQQNIPPPPITTTSSTRALRLSQTLTSLDATMYGAYWCSHCYDQKQALGKEAMKEIRYVECAKEGLNSQQKVCKDRGVPGFPTWDIAGTLYPGEWSVEELEEIVDGALNGKGGGGGSS